MKNISFILAFCIVLGVSAQVKKPKEKPVFTEVSNKDIVQSVFPEAAKVEKLNDLWYRVLDGQNKVLGFALSSSNACEEVKGYHAKTPVMIVTNKAFEIKKTALLSYWETKGHVRKLQKKGFFDLWNGKTLSAAKTVKLDAYTGATITAKAVGRNVNFLLKNGIKKLPQN